jgi:hypothetical protein
VLGNNDISPRFGDSFDFDDAFIFPACSDSLGPGFFQVGTSSLFLSTYPPDYATVTWTGAQEKCAQHGLRPAMLKTQKLLDGTVDMLNKYVNMHVPLDFTFLIGLRYTSPLLPLW